MDEYDNEPEAAYEARHPLPARLRELAEALKAVEWEVPITAQETCIEAAAAMIETLVRTRDVCTRVRGSIDEISCLVGLDPRIRRDLQLISRAIDMALQ